MRRVVLVTAAVLAFAGGRAARAGEVEHGRDSGRHGALVVDDDRVQCPDADFTSIQAAVLASKPGGTVRVCPGTYHEDVDVDRTLRLEGAGPAPELRTGDPSQEAVVQPADVGFVVNADRVEIEGFTLLGSGHFPGTTGIAVNGATSGHRFAGNFLTHHDLGIAYFAAPGRRLPSVIRENRIEHSHEAIVLATTSATRPEPDLFPVRVEHNLIVESQNAIGLRGVRGVEVRENTLQDCELGVITDQAADDTIFGNTFSGGPNANVGIFASQSTGLRIALNRANGITASFGFPSVGIWIDLGGDNLLIANQTNGNASDGILLSGSDGNTVSLNESDQNGLDGIRLGGSKGNALFGNRMTGNGEFDAYDDARTTNSWVATHCDTDFPPGTICNAQ